MPFAVAFNVVINYKHKRKRYAMNILVTNDDGINAESLWIPVQELKYGKKQLSLRKCSTTLVRTS